MKLLRFQAVEVREIQTMQYIVVGKALHNNTKVMDMIRREHMYW